MNNTKNIPQEITQKLKGIILIDVELTNVSPLIIGSGKNEILDIELMRYPDGRPYIPATSYFGVLKHLFFDEYDLKNCNEIQVLKNLTYWLGNFTDYFEKDADISKTIRNKNIEFQSHILAKDLVAQENSFTISYRDGIEIEDTTQLTKKNSKYDFEIIEPGAIFNGLIKLKIREGIDEDILSLILYFLKNKIAKVKYGRNTTSGYGKMKLRNINIKRYDGEAWIKKLEGKETDSDISIKIDSLKKLELCKNKQKYFKAIIDAEIWNSLLLGSRNIMNSDSDKVFIKYTNQNKINEIPIPGRAYKQALLKRIQRIATTIGAKVELNNLKGTDKNGKPEKTSRLTAEETTFKLSDVSENIHHRIKIDHFTGGTMPNAKFDSTPMWHKNETLLMEICIHQYKNEEAALLVHAIKDLVTSDLPIGGEKSIGRGRLKGKQIKLEWTDDDPDLNNLIITLEGDNIKLDNKESIVKLNKINDELINLKQS